MHWLENWLSLKSDFEEGITRLHFTQPHWRARGCECVIEKKPGVPLAEPGFSEIPDFFTRFVFLSSHGLKDYRPLMCLRSSSGTGDVIGFYSCLDRKGRNRILVCAAQLHQDGVGSFILTKEDFESIYDQLAEIEKRSLQAA